MTGAAPGFDYERGLWGLDRVDPGDRSIAGFRLGEALRCLPTRGAVLELGCGAGRMLGGVRRARPGLRLVGMDVSAAALAHAARCLPGVELRRVEDPAAPLPAPDGEFDAVLVLDVLEHLADPRRALTELHRVLAAGGALHLNVPCEGDALCLWRWLPPPLRGLKRELAGHVQRFRRRELLALLEEAGFEVTRVRYSLHALGGLADLAAFLGIAAAARWRRDRPPPTTGDLLASRGAAGAGAGARMLRFGVGAVDAALWAEAQLLCRLPSWNLHVTARRGPG